MVKRFLGLITVLLFSLMGENAFSQINCLSSASFYTGCPPLVVNFQDLSTGGASSHYWNFAEFPTTTSNLQNPSNTFENPGYYNVQHIAYYPGGLSDTCYLLIQVYQPPQVNFTAPNHYGCLPHQVQFQNTSIAGSAPINNWVWDFGNCAPNSTQQNPVINIPSTGACNVALIAQDANGCSNSKIVSNYLVTGMYPQANYTQNIQTSCISPSIVSFSNSSSSTNGNLIYQWNFDPGTSALQNPSVPVFNGQHNVELIVTDTLGCSDTSSSLISIADFNASFSSSSPGACNGIPFFFTNTTNPSFGNAVWNFGDGSPNFSGWNANHTYTTNGVFLVTLTVSFGNCSDTYTQQIQVSSPLSASINATAITSCTTPFTTSFSNSNNSASAYIWTFGDGDSAFVASPTHTFSSPGLFDVTLFLQNNSGCISSQSFNDFIQISQPVAQFTVSEDTGCAPFTTVFTNTSLSSSPIVSQFWIFGNGNTSSAINPSYTYNTAGNFQARLVVTNADGCIDTSNALLIKVVNSFNAAFSINDNTLCNGQALQITNNSTVFAPGTQVRWYFGDGTFANGINNSSHVYVEQGTYSVTLIAAYGSCRDTAGPLTVSVLPPVANFVPQFFCNSNVVNFSDSSVGATSLQWIFGDGNMSSVQNPSHSYASPGTYSVMQIAFNNSSFCYDTAIQNLNVGSISAGFTIDTIVGCNPMVVYFQDTSSGANSWFWDFGDGFTSVTNTPSPIHVYLDTGLYTVTLIINGGSQCPDTVTYVDYIYATGSVADFTASPTTGCAPLTVQFTDLSLALPGNIVSWMWTFDDGDTSYVQNPIHVFQSNGNYDIKLRVTDNNGCVATKIINNYIKPRKPQTNFFVDSFICVNEPLFFDNLTGSSANQHLWNFGDGTTSTQPDPTYSYSTAGVYTVSLLSTNSLGCDSLLVKPMHVTVGNPIADFVSNSTFTPCPPFAVVFTNTTNRPNLEYFWLFGDGSSSAEKDPIKVYFEPGSYDVTLIVRDSAHICSDTIVKPGFININGPLININLHADTGCAPFTVQLTGTASNYSSLDFDMGNGVGWSGTNTLSATYTEPGIYYPIATATDNLGCTVIFRLDTVAVGVVPHPGLSPDTIVCRGNFVSFNLPYGDNFQWFPSTDLTCDSCANTVSEALDTITYIVNVSTSYGCYASDTITLNVEELPALNPGLKFRICRGDTLQLNAGPVSSCVWSPQLYMNDSNLVNPKVWPSDSIEYRVTAGNTIGCIISKLVKVYVLDSVDIQIAPDTLLCIGQSVQLQSEILQQSFNGIQFQWTPSFGLSNPNIAEPIANPSTSQTYSLIASGPYCIPDTESVYVQVSPVPKVKAGDDAIVSVGTEVQIYASSPDQVVYQWSNYLDSVYCPVCRITKLILTRDQVIYVRATNQWGCFSEDSVVLNVVSCENGDGVFIPNTFTPNGDGLNDVLFVRGKGIETLNEFLVFDRWGELVFQSNDIQNGWDGSFKGVPLNSQTFIYIAKGTCTNGAGFDTKGNVTLFR